MSVVSYRLARGWQGEAADRRGRDGVVLCQAALLHRSEAPAWCRAPTSTFINGDGCAGTSPRRLRSSFSASRRRPVSLLLPLVFSLSSYFLCSCGWRRWTGKRTLGSRVCGSHRGFYWWQARARSGPGKRTAEDSRRPGQHMRQHPMAWLGSRL